MSRQRLNLPLTRVRWLQEMGIAPAMLRAHMEPGPEIRQPAARAPLPRLSEQLQAARTEAPVEQKSPVAPPAAAQAKPTPAAPPEPAPAPVQVQATDFSSWCTAVQDCQGCDRSQSRAQVFTGIGMHEQPEWFVLGGAPTRQDEAAAQAWQSAAGRLLLAQLQAIGLSLEQHVYCSYALKCYAPEPTPSAESVAACQGVFYQELAFVRPKRLLLLGQSAVSMVFGAQARLNALRGAVQQWQPETGPALPVVVGFDPAALLLRPQQKAQAWQDLLLMQSLMNESP